MVCKAVRGILWTFQGPTPLNGFGDMPDRSHDIYAILILNTNPFLFNSGSEILPGPNPNEHYGVIPPSIVVMTLDSYLPRI